MKSPEFSDEKIGVLTDQKISDATSWYSGKLSRERSKVLQYVEGKLPAPYHPNGSRWVNPTCYIAGMYMQAMLGDTFSAGSGTVKFDARTADDVPASRVQSEYTAHVFYKQNNGEKLIRDTIFDGLTARVAIAKVFWEKDDGAADIEEEFDNVDDAELQNWLARPEEIIHLEYETYTDGTHGGRLIRRSDKSQVRIELVTPEEFAVARHTQDLATCDFCVHRTTRTIGWIKAQYPEMEGKEDELRSGAAEEISSIETLTRFESVTEGIRTNDENEGDEMEVTLSEAYWRFKREGDLRSRLYKVLRCGTVTIDIEPVDELPFVCFTPLPYAHRFYGENYIKRVMPTQDILTAAERSIMDHAMRTNNPRYMVMNGTVETADELLDNRLGGVVNVNNMDGIAPLQPPQMNPMVFSLVQSMNQLQEQITGISSASIGQNKDAISTPNSAALFEKVTGMSQIRQKEIARNFATQFLCPLYEKINRLVIQFEKTQRQIEVAGEFIAVDPSKWFAGRAATAAAHLGYGEREAKARMRMEWATQMKQNGGEVFMGYDGFYNVVTDALTDVGERSNVGRYLPITPDQVQPPGPSPMEQAEVAVKQAEAFKLQAEGQAVMKKVDQHAELTVMKHKLNEFEAMMQAHQHDRDSARKEAETQNRIETSRVETALLVNPPADAQTRGIISP